MAIDVLLTGFEPFAGATTNESWEAVLGAAAQLREQGLEVVEVELPVEFGRAGDLIAAAVREHLPRLVVAVGLAAGRRGITPERVAINVRDARIPDNAGACPVDDPVIAGGPVGHLTSLPIKALVAALADEGVPGSVSQTAGTYVCNDVFYRLQHLLATDADLVEIRGGFIHVPAAEVVDAATASRALTAMVRVALETPTDLERPGGAEH